MGLVVSVMEMELCYTVVNESGDGDGVAIQELKVKRHERVLDRGGDLVNGYGPVAERNHDGNNAGNARRLV
ncbi:hypothetical protein C5167_035450 [Papaver somniferum]|uniref:Uncharacterized protein n=1 Tax=Papaver somniferum TaxID=3469 RepID=A0A4Y7KFY8_PAPSO|nr:hypothetical protein C5167_035450 [Papaver somniferum]